MSEMTRDDMLIALARLEERLKAHLRFAFSEAAEKEHGIAEVQQERIDLGNEIDAVAKAIGLAERLP